MKVLSRILIISTILSVSYAFALPAQTGTQEAYAASKVKISKTKATIPKGKTLQLRMIGTKKKAKWSSSKKSVAIVSKNGKVAAKKNGKATITAKVGSKKYSCKITVKVLPNYRKDIVNKWAGHTNDIDYLEWEFYSNGKFDYLYYHDVMHSRKVTDLSGSYTISGDKLKIKSGTVKATYTITKLEKDNSLILKNKINTYNLYLAHP